MEMIKMQVLMMKNKQTNKQTKIPRKFIKALSNIFIMNSPH